MPFNPAPTGYFSNAIIDSSGIFIPYSDFESYNIDSSGDIRQLVYSFNNQVANIYESLTSDNRSNDMIVSSSQGFVTNTSIRKNFSLSFNLAFSGVFSVENE